MIIKHSKPTLDATDIAAVSKVIRSNHIAQGETVRKFEKKLAKFIGAYDAVAASSGTAALHLALLALDTKKGDEVIIPSYVCLALLNAVNYTGATPKLCDINADDFNISLKEVERKINKRTKAIIVPHMFGMPADIENIVKLGIPIIEDCAHAIGSKVKEKKAGSFGAMSIFSFYATKMLTCAEGGMASSNSRKLLNKMREMRDYDKKDKLTTCFNYKMSDVQAAWGLNQLSKLPSFIAKRKKIASEYNSCFCECNIKLPNTCKKEENVFYRYIVKTNKNLDKAIRDLDKRGIACRRPVYKPIHRYLNLKGFHNTEIAWKTSLSLPIYPSLTQTEIKKIKSIISDYFGGK